MLELVEELFAREGAYVVGGAVRDELLGRAVIDLDVALREPERAARRYAGRSGGAPFPLSERHGAWRVALDGGRTVDFTPLPGTIEDDLATRDFTINAVAEPVGGGAIVDPFGGREDVAAGILRVVTDGVFEDDPLRLLRAARLEDELGFPLEPGTEALVRRHAALVTRPSGERIVQELRRLSADGYRRLDDLGLLAPLGGALDQRLDRVDSPEYRLLARFPGPFWRLPLSQELPPSTPGLPPAQGPPAA